MCLDATGAEIGHPTWVVDPAHLDELLEDFIEYKHGGGTYEGATWHVCTELEATHVDIEDTDGVARALAQLCEANRVRFFPAPYSRTADELLNDPPSLMVMIEPDEHG